MEAISFFICEQAIIHPDNTIDVFRYYRTSFIPESLPWNISFSVFYHILFESKDRGEHVLKIMLSDSGGNDRILFHQSLIVDQDPYEWIDCRLLQNILLTKLGTHTLTLKLNNKKLAAYDIKILDRTKGSKSLLGFQPGIDTKPSS